MRPTDDVRAAYIRATEEGVPAGTVDLRGTLEVQQIGRRSHLHVRSDIGREVTRVCVVMWDEPFVPPVPPIWHYAFGERYA